MGEIGGTVHTTPAAMESSQMVQTSICIICYCASRKSAKHRFVFLKKYGFEEAPPLLFINERPFGRFTCDADLSGLN